MEEFSLTPGQSVRGRPDRKALCKEPAEEPDRKALGKEPAEEEFQADPRSLQTILNGDLAVSICRLSLWWLGQVIVSLQDTVGHRSTIVGLGSTRLVTYWSGRKLSYSVRS